ncbi:MAG TPA: alpha-L-fucosidase, partial [Bacteroidales bacterium]|nr:alpha-L-fucosidase [Bacteroidales bacterium]
MKRYSYLLIILIAYLSGLQSAAQTYKPEWESLDKRKVPAWFNESKFGIFIHWGLYSVPSFSRVVPDGYSEWYWCNYNDQLRQNHKAVTEFHNRTYGDGFTYDKFQGMFKAELFDPDEWAAIFKRSG